MGKMNDKMLIDELPDAWIGAEAVFEGDLDLFF